MRYKVFKLLTTSSFFLSQVEQPSYAAREAVPFLPLQVEMSVKPGNKRTLRETDIIAPIAYENDTLFFLNARGMRDTKKQKEGNIGFGIRKLINDMVIVGGYGHGDARRSIYGNTLYQLTGGIEVLSEWIDIRANGYRPRAKRHILSNQKVAMAVNNTILIGDYIFYERALRGFDLEAGVKLPIGLHMPLPLPFIDEVRAFVGRYSFFHKREAKIQGTRGRFELSATSIFEDSSSPLLQGAKLTVAGEVSKDKIRGLNRFIEIRLRIPLWGRNQERVLATGLRRRLTDRVVRDVDIVNEQRFALENEVIFDPMVNLNNATANPASVYWFRFNASSNGDGSLSRPFNTIPSNIKNHAIFIIMDEGNINLNGIINWPAEVDAIISLSRISFPDIIKSRLIDPNGNFVQIPTNKPKFVINTAPAGISYMLVNNEDKDFSIVGVDFEGNPTSYGVRTNYQSAVNGTFTYRDMEITHSTNAPGGILMFYQYLVSASGTKTINVENITVNYNLGGGIDINIANTPSTGNLIAELENITVSQPNYGIFLQNRGASTANFTANMRGGMNLTGNINSYYLHKSGAQPCTLNIYTTAGANSFTPGYINFGGWTINAF